MWPFRHKPKQLYYHTEWTEHNLDEIRMKIDKLRMKMNKVIKEFDASK